MWVEECGYFVGEIASAGSDMFLVLSPPIRQEDSAPPHLSSGSGSARRRGGVQVGLPAYRPSAGGSGRGRGEGPRPCVVSRVPQGSAALPSRLRGGVWAPLGPRSLWGCGGSGVSPLGWRACGLAAAALCSRVAAGVGGAPPRCAGLAGVVGRGPPVRARRGGVVGGGVAAS